MGAYSRIKGMRREREIKNLHLKIGIHAETVPMSGALGYQSNGQDVDVYAWGKNRAPLCCQVKACKPGGHGTKGIVDALGDADALFIRYDAEPGGGAPPPLVVLPWSTWERLLRLAL